MGNVIFIENKKVCVKPLRSRLEAIQKLQPPKTPKGYRSFVGVVNFLSMFCPELQKFATGSTLYQIQNGKPKLIAYTSKRLPGAAKSYSITELELCGLAINIASFAHLFKRVDFNAIVDHLALTHIIKSKMELATTGIKRLLELISSYPFNLYYMKGKDIFLSDFLSQQNNDDNNPSEIIPISFNT